MINRRKFFKHSAGGLGALMLPLSSPTSKKVLPGPATTRALRIAHITDVHILDQKNAATCFARVMNEINAMKDKPDIIINTGDSVMDENAELKETVARHWTIWRDQISGNKIPMMSAIGNHDVWYGPDAVSDADYKRDKRYGKQWAIEMLSLPHRFYSFEKKGWQFIALDSINGESGYQLDEEQFEWLRGELKKSSGHPICIFNHVPILAMGPLLYETKRKPLKEIGFPSGDMHNDHQRIKDLFFEHKNVKLCLSGHVHYIDEVEYLGVKYLCNGAVSGNWWRDPLVLDEFPPVYAIIDLYTDGTSVCELKAYDHRS